MSKLSTLFLTSFAELVVILEQTQAEEKAGQSANVMTIKYNAILRNMDVLFALMQKTKLKKENQIAMMKGIKAFIDDPRTKKRAYKLMARIVEKYEIENGVQELVQVHQELTSHIEGQNSKQRLLLIKSYIKQIQKMSSDENN